MHILHVTPYYAPAYEYGGVVRAVEGMARAQIAHGHRVSILTTDAHAPHAKAQPLPPRAIHDGAAVFRARNASHALRWRYNLSSPRGLRRMAKPLLADVDVVHLHEFRTVENLLLTPLFAQAGIPMVMSPHGTLIYETGRSALKQIWDRLFSRRVARRIGQVIALSAQEQADVQHLWQALNMPDVPIRVIPNGVQVFRQPTRNRFVEQHQLAGKRVVLFVGRLHARKGVDVLVRAFKQADVPDSVLVLAGPDQGMLAQLKPLLDERIILTGYLNEQQRDQALSHARVFALPATGEGLPMAVLEALSAGLPVIISPGCNLPEVGDAEAGLIVEPQVEPLAQALRHLLMDEAQRQRMGQNARVLVAERFTWGAVAAQLDAVYAAVRSKQAELR